MKVKSIATITAHATLTPVPCPGAAFDCLNRQDMGYQPLRHNSILSLEGVRGGGVDVVEGLTERCRLQAGSKG